MTPLEWSDEGRAPMFAAYAKAQTAMGAVMKDRENPAFKSHYATLASAIEAVIPALSSNGIATIQSPSFDGEIVTVETILAHAEGGWAKSCLSVRPGKVDAQGIGSAITYLRRYALMALAGVAPEDDDGNAASAKGEPGQKFSPPPAPPAPKPNLSQRAAAFEASLKEAAHDPAKLEKTFKLGAGLCADLDRVDPERLAQITKLYESLQETQEEVFA